MTDVAAPTHNVPVQCGRDSADVTPQWFVNGSEYNPHLATFRPLVNGEEAFDAVYRAIDAAKKSVCIICWGFQPSMYFIRKGTHPPIGELLRMKAREGKTVRVLSWAFNLLGAVPVTGLALGEPNLPGRRLPGFPGDTPKTATEEQYNYDVSWFGMFDRQFSITHEFSRMLVRHAAAKDPSFATTRENLRFFSRSYSMEDSAKIREVDYIDKGLSLTTKLTLMFTPTHHQKMVVVDYEDPEAAVGFVMGHNMLDGYWDTSEHSGKQQRADAGRNGAVPLHDYSSRVTGTIVGDVFRNFADAWQKETGESLPMPDFDSYPLLGDDGRAMCQILRTQPQYGKQHISECYLQAVSNASQYIHIENQYFRWPPLAERITKAANDMTGCGRKPERHGPLYLFVISNTSDGGMGAGTVNTYRMLELLGRADRIPEVARHQRLETIEKDLDAVNDELRADEAIDQGRKAQLEARKLELEEQRDRLKPKSWHEKTFGSDRTPEVIMASEVPGLKVHIATLVAPDTQDGEEWQEVYIHAKLMLIDDAFMTLGSANINTRSMQVDSELNIAHHRPEITAPLRAQQWDKYTKGRVLPGMPLKEAFQEWGVLIQENTQAKGNKLRPRAQLAEFLRDSPPCQDSCRLPILRN